MEYVNWTEVRESGINLCKEIVHVLTKVEVTILKVTLNSYRMNKHLLWFSYDKNIDKILSITRF